MSKSVHKESIDKMLSMANEKFLELVNEEISDADVIKTNCLVNRIMFMYLDELHTIEMEDYIVTERFGLFEEEYLVRFFSAAMFRRFLEVVGSVHGEKRFIAFGVPSVNFCPEKDVLGFTMSMGVKKVGVAI